MEQDQEQQQEPAPKKLAFLNWIGVAVLILACIRRIADSNVRLRRKTQFIRPFDPM